MRTPLSNTSLLLKRERRNYTLVLSGEFNGTFVLFTNTGELFLGAMSRSLVSGISTFREKDGWTQGRNGRAGPSYDLREGLPAEAAPLVAFFDEWEPRTSTSCSVATAAPIPALVVPIHRKPRWMKQAHPR